MGKINTFWKLRVSNNSLTNYTKYVFLKNESIHFGCSTDLKLTVVSDSASKSSQEAEFSFMPTCKTWPVGKWVCIIPVS